MSEKYFKRLRFSRVQHDLALISEMEIQRQEMLSILGLKNNEIYADIGSGTGAMVEEANKILGPSGKSFGIDISPKMIEQAKKDYPNCVFIEGDMTNLQFEDNSLDALSMAQALSFCKNADKAIAEIFRVLKPGGRAVILDTDWQSLVWNSPDPDLTERAVDLLLTKYHDPHLPRTLSRRLTAVGFEIGGRSALNLTNWSFETDSYAYQTCQFIKAMMEEAPAFTSRDLERFLSLQIEIDNIGDYLFSLNRYIFMAIKPA